MAADTMITPESICYLSQGSEQRALVRLSAREHVGTRSYLLDSALYQRRAFAAP